MTGRPNDLGGMVLDAVADDYEEFNMVVSQIAEWTKNSASNPAIDQIELALMNSIADRDIQAYEYSESSCRYLAVEADPASIRTRWFYITEQGKRRLLEPTVLTALTREPIDAEGLVAAAKRGEDGAVVVFDGVVRNHTRGRQTLYLDYEAYEEMAGKQMAELAADARKMFGVRHVTMVHRLGRLEVGETSVLIVVASAHRAQAFEACRWLIDTLKQTVPIWKKETFVDGAVWAAGEPFPAGMAVAPPEGSDEP
ncbi:MAG: molybdenum cofactor biosynthesis protein MoaE [Terracidiphilus sp.]|jgi:molybdopterin synthase catalytic subunit